MNRIPRLLTTMACLALLGTMAAACGDDAEANQPANHEAAEAHDNASVIIEGVDYRFENVPASIPAGTRIGFRNLSEKELHELVAFRLDTDMPLNELLALPPAELEGMLGVPVTVMLQPPGAPQATVAVGDGTLTEPGRYLLMCFIPVGADPAEYLAAVAAAGGGKPEGVAGGPSHFVTGMVAELTVE